MDPTDPESAHIKEVYAHFGLAMFHSQCLERQIAILLATTHGPGLLNVTRNQFDSLLESLFHKTLGSLISDIRSVMDLSDGMATKLSDALRKRNWLTHGYFWERATAFTTTAGRASMIEELLTIGDSFHRIDQRLTRMTYEWAEANGVTREMIQQELDRLLQDA